MIGVFGSSTFLLSPVMVLAMVPIPFPVVISPVLTPRAGLMIRLRDEAAQLHSHQGVQHRHDSNNDEPPNPSVSGIHGLFPWEMIVLFVELAAKGAETVEPALAQDDTDGKAILWMTLVEEVVTVHEIIDIHIIRVIPGVGPILRPWVDDIESEPGILKMN